MRNLFSVLYSLFFALSSLLFALSSVLCPLSSVLCPLSSVPPLPYYSITPLLRSASARGVGVTFGL